MLISSDVPLVTVSARAGHARTSTTSDIYAHFIKSSDKTAAQVIDKMFQDEVLKESKSEMKPLPIPAEIKVKPQKNEEMVSENNDSVLDFLDDFKRAKEEMKRLGFDCMEEYEEYLDFIEL